ncbi:hypothetical protein [Altererythrobacter sp. TH136]|uniref:hypothetical protein n=1 Tax=Altererythrobacter sp. TH136 TaxID=2067415 RepID=UPI00143D083E|nr:hypothetical protein [Altererythrobacter sp. TH136]
MLIEVRDDGDDGWEFVSPWNDEELHEIHLHNTFGTRSHAATTAFLGEVGKLCRRDFDHDIQQWKINETDLNAALDWIASIEPRNPIEAATALQMLALHRMQMSLSRGALNSGGMVMTREAALAGKLSQRFAMLQASLRDGRGTRKPISRQSIKVSKETHHHQHIHVHRRDQQNDGQPHGPTDALIDQCAALPSPNQAGDGLPLPSDEREARVPHSRGQEPRRAKGKG